MKALILCGGSGTRLWPVSRGQYPKQFLKFNKEASFLQQTIKRTLAIAAPSEIFLVTNRHFFHEVSSQAAEVDSALKENVIVEPEQKNTAPAIALAIAYLKEREKLKKEEVVFISPSDHLIAPLNTFAKLVKEALPLAKEGNLVTFGIPPSRPETGYGYIQQGAPLGDAGFEVAQFVEKPSLEVAKSYLKKGDFLWNSGMFAFSLATFEKELQAHAPKLAALFEKKYATFAKEFEKAPSVSIDYAILEKSNKVSVSPLSLSWSDVGSWDNIYEVSPKDENGNVVLGEGYPIDTKNSLLYSKERLVATVGVEDLAVIETEDAVLVAKRGEGQKVKEVVAHLNKVGKKEAIEHLTVHRPWGKYTVLGEGGRFKIKRIRVEPTQTLSLQKHYHRSEHWVVVKGTAEVTIGDTVSIVHEGESIFVPKSAIHRVKNPGKVPLEIIEVQVGEYLGEDDIIRLEDVYGRLCT